MENDDLFEFDDVIDNTENIEEIFIDINNIDEESNKDAQELINNLSHFYYDEEFMNRNPILKKRVDSELETMRVLIKMRKTDEQAHDILLKAIGNNANNASLYKSLTEIQKTILSITTKMTEIINGLNILMKNYQTELNFKEENNNNDISDEDSEESISNLTKGSKDFIKNMIKINELKEFNSNKVTAES